jgi:dynactin 1
MRQTIEDLEALKDLNDELEENHVEAEKQLSSEIGELLMASSVGNADCPDTLTVRLRDERQRSTDLDSLVLDTEATLNQFRDLVANLQRQVSYTPRWKIRSTDPYSEIDSLRLQQASQEVNSASTSKEAQSILNLNLKLQSTAAKMQNKAIDIELKNLEATQLSEHLRIVQVSFLISRVMPRNTDSFRPTCPTLTQKPKPTRPPSISHFSASLPRQISSLLPFSPSTLSPQRYMPIIQHYLP